MQINDVDVVIVVVQENVQDNTKKNEHQDTYTYTWTNFIHCWICFVIPFLTKKEQQVTDL